MLSWLIDFNILSMLRSNFLLFLKPSREIVWNEKQLFSVLKQKRAWCWPICVILCEVKEKSSDTLSVCPPLFFVAASHASSACCLTHFSAPFRPPASSGKKIQIPQCSEWLSQLCSTKRHLLASLSLDPDVKACFSYGRLAAMTDTWLTVWLAEAGGGTALPTASVC